MVTKPTFEEASPAPDIDVSVPEAGLGDVYVPEYTFEVPDVGTGFDAGVGVVPSFGATQDEDFFGIRESTVSPQLNTFSDAVLSARYANAVDKSAALTQANFTQQPDGSWQGPATDLLAAEKTLGITITGQASQTTAEDRFLEREDRADSRALWGIALTATTSLAGILAQIWMTKDAQKQSEEMWEKQAAEARAQMQYSRTGVWPGQAPVAGTGGGGDAVSSQPAWTPVKPTAIS